MEKLLEKIETVRAETGMSLMAFSKAFDLSYQALRRWVWQGAQLPEWEVQALLHYIDYRRAGGKPAEPPVGENPVRYLVSLTGLSQRGFARALEMSRCTVGSWCTEDRMLKLWLYPVLHEWLVYNGLIKAE